MNSKKKVLLIHTPFKSFSFGNQWQRLDSLAPPLGLMYLADPLIKSGWQVEFIDLNIDKFNKTEFIQKIKKYRFIGLSCYSESLKNSGP